MAKVAMTKFDPKAFPCQGGDGKNDPEIGEDISTFDRERGGCCFYIQKGRVKLTVLSEQGKEA